MSQDPSMMPYASPGVDLPPQRPGGVTAIAIIGIIYGGLGTLVNACGVIGTLFMNAAVRAGGSAGGPQPFVMPPELQAFNATAASIGGLLSLMLLIGSIGALSLR